MSSEDEAVVILDDTQESESDDTNSSTVKKDDSVEQMECSLEENAAEDKSNEDESLEKMECSIDDNVSCPQTENVSTFYFNYPNLAITNISINIPVCYTQFHRAPRSDYNNTETCTHGSWFCCTVGIPIIKCYR